jgi:hypothetical protein
MEAATYQSAVRVDSTGCKLSATRTDSGEPSANLASLAACKALWRTGDCIVSFDGVNLVFPYGNTAGRTPSPSLGRMMAPSSRQIPTTCTQNYRETWGVEDERIAKARDKFNSYHSAAEKADWYRAHGRNQVKVRSSHALGCARGTKRNRGPVRPIVLLGFPLEPLEPHTHSGPP